MSRLTLEEYDAAVEELLDKDACAPSPASVSRALAGMRHSMSYTQAAQQALDRDAVHLHTEHCLKAWRLILRACAQDDEWASLYIDVWNRVGKFSFK